MTARRAEEVHIAPTASLAEVVLAVTDECMTHWRSNVEGVTSDRHLESLHQLRVGVRRFRSALVLFGRSLDDPQVAWLSAEIRELALPFGAGRDLDVVLLECGAELDTDARSALTAQREAAYDTIIEILTGPRWEEVWQLVERFRGHLATGDATGRPARPATDEALERRWRKVVERGAKLRTLSPLDRHRIRIEAKKLRYGAQFFADLYPAADDPDPLAYADVVAELQSSLGELNDAHTRATILHSVGATPPAFDEESVVEASVAIHARLRALPCFWPGRATRDDHDR